MTPPRLLLAACAALLLVGTLGAASATNAPQAPRILMDRAQGSAQHVLADGESPPPSGPSIPTLQDGIGPGSGLHQFDKAGSQNEFLCTAAFILRDPVTAKYYLSTAGHCIVRDETDPKPYTGAANPDKVDQVIQVCVSQCIDNALGLGTYVTLAAKGSYQPVTFGQSNGVGDDFGIIELPADRHDLIRPWMPQFGGPTGYDPSSAGDYLVHYGHGSYCCPLAGGAATRSPVDQGRIAVSLGNDGNSFNGIGSFTGGDSGSAVNLGVPDPLRGMAGGAAVGVFTHTNTLTGYDNVPTLFGTTLKHGLDMVRKATGLSLQLVLQDDPLTAAPQPASVAHIEVRDPVLGGTVRPGADGTYTISGTSGLGNATPPSDALVQVAIDDATFGSASRVPVAGVAHWNASWDLHGVPLGRHVLYARLMGADGPLASINGTVTVVSRSSTQTSGPGSSGSGAGTGTGAGKGTGGSTKGTGANGAGSTGTAAKKSPAPAAVASLASLGLAAATHSLLEKRRRRR